jgi:hypothetical protein
LLKHWKRLLHKNHTITFRGIPETCTNNQMGPCSCDKFRMEKLNGKLGPGGFEVILVSKCELSGIW